MHSIEEVSERVQNDYSKGVKSDDSRLSKRYIYSNVKNIRNKLHVNKANKRQALHEDAYSIVKCVEMVAVSSIECSAFAPLGCTVYRSKHKLPSITHSMFNPLVEWVTTLDRQFIIDPVTRVQSKYMNFSKFPNRNRRYVIENNFLYVLSPKAPKALTMKAVFSDPVEFHNYMNKASENFDCRPIYKKDLFVDPSEVETLVKMVNASINEDFKRGREDLTNDNKDNLKKETK